MKIPFVKMHGNGNDFVVIDNTKSIINKEKSLIRKLANRKIGIGCDQLILMENSSKYDVFMKIYNSDGTEAEMCGNAARCVASLFMAGVKKKEVKIETISCIITANLEKNNEIKTSIALPKQDLKNILKKGYQNIINLEEIHPLLKEGNVINMGNPHVVFFLKSLNLINLSDIGGRIENHKAFTKGINVEVVEVISDSSLKIKFWERGAGETLSCGSGILAATYASFKNKKCLNTVKVILPLGSVKVNITKDLINITGKAEVSFLGEYDYV
ncbi:MAG: diaminopimelate epimerase [Rickettsiales bacterium]|nr:diaminopimelate epimerase [Rickettsiales bacterium]OUV79473.1 MAG: diaminopimelate epimerase [Rickettsiales bacterium TMED131]